MTKSYGRSHIKIDPKGRLSLPKSFRSDLQKSTHLCITNNIYQGYRFLDMYSEADWQKFAKKVSSWPTMKPEIQAFQRFYVSSVELCELDGQGRLLIPSHLREYAKLSDDIVLVGMGAKIEIWNSKDWQSLFSHIEKDYARISDVIAEIDEKNMKPKKEGRE